MNNLEIGKLGEEIALNYLKSKKYKLLTRNYSKKLGEIDLVVSKNRRVYFVEVKTILGEFDRDNLVERIDKKKYKRLANTSIIYLKENNLISSLDWNLSGILVSIDQNNLTSEIEFIENLF